MQLDILAEERRVTISRFDGPMKLKPRGGTGNCLPCRSILPSLLLAAVLMPFVFIRIAFLGACPSISCMGWRIGPRFFKGIGDSSSKELMNEVMRIYLGKGEDEGLKLDSKIVDEAPDSLDELLAEMSSVFSYDQLDIKTFILKTKAMLIKMDQKVQDARFRAATFQHLAAIGIPKSMHCISLRLAEEYLMNAIARSSLPTPELASCLTDVSYIHIVLITDNILAAAVVISSTLKSSNNPENVVFHVVTDKKTYTAMHAWFALHPVGPAILEVKGLHQFNFPAYVSDSIMKTVEEIRKSSSDYRHYGNSNGADGNFSVTDPSMFSSLQYMRIHLPELFPKLKRIIFLDDDVLVRKDLAPLLDLDLSGKVIGAVSACNSNKVDDKLCVGKKFGDYINFSSAILSSTSSLALHEDQCAWMEGINIIDLQSWRKTNITEIYQYWLKINSESDFSLWPMGFIPPTLIAFDGQVHAIDPSWQISGLGCQMPNIKLLESAAVLHFSGLRKPWLEIGFPELHKMWHSHLNQSDELITSCRVLE